MERTTTSRGKKTAEVQYAITSLSRPRRRRGLAHDPLARPLGDRELALGPRRDVRRRQVPGQDWASSAELELRDARFIVGIRMHTQGMTIEQAEDFFEQRSVPAAAGRRLRDEARHVGRPLRLLHAGQARDPQAARGLQDQTWRRVLAAGASTTSSCGWGRCRCHSCARRCWASGDRRRRVAIAPALQRALRAMDGEQGACWRLQRPASHDAGASPPDCGVPRQMPEHRRPTK